VDMPFVTDFVSRTGGREINEDHCGFLELGESACWVVADGLGGCQGGEAAARIAVEAALNSFKANPRLSTAALQSHLQAAQQAVLQAQKAQPKLSTMRTTIVILITDSIRVFWAHVGDSRLYCFQNGRIVFCTTDHSVVQAMVKAGELSPEQARHNEDRNRLLRCLGNPDGDLRPTTLDHPRNLVRGTSFLMCTDGFWENITETEMEVDFTKVEASGEWLALMTDRVMQHIKDDSDNYTAMVAAFNSAPAANFSSVSKLPQEVRPDAPDRSKADPLFPQGDPDTSRVRKGLNESTIGADEDRFQTMNHFLNTLVYGPTPSPPARVNGSSGAKRSAMWIIAACSLLLCTGSFAGVWLRSRKIALHPPNTSSALKSQIVDLNSNLDAQRKNLEDQTTQSAALQTKASNLEKLNQALSARLDAARGEHATVVGGCKTLKDQLKATANSENLQPLIGSLKQIAKNLQDQLSARQASMSRYRLFFWNGDWDRKPEHTRLQADGDFDSETLRYILCVFSGPNPLPGRQFYSSAMDVRCLGPDKQLKKRRLIGASAAPGWLSGLHPRVGEMSSPAPLAAGSGRLKYGARARGFGSSIFARIECAQLTFGTAATPLKLLRRVIAKN